MLKTETNLHNTFGNSSPVCPHCGWKDDDTIEYRGGDGDQTQTTCGSCDKVFDVYINVERTFTTNCLEEEHEMVTNGVYKPIAENPHRYLYCKNCEYTAWNTDEACKKYKSVEVVEEYPEL